MIEVVCSKTHMDADKVQAFMPKKTYAFLSDTPSPIADG